MKGTVFNIQRFSIHDGPSIRTAVFFKGCPLRCEWCHNPEGLAQRPVLSYIAAKCAGCGVCQSVCEKGVHGIADDLHTLARDACVACGQCVSACPAGALEILGREYTVDEVVDAVMRDRLFYRDGGGATLTGGEPLAQGRFAVAVARALHEKGVNVCVETSGYAEAEIIREIAPFVDLFLFDVKETDDDRHRRYTGVGRKRIDENLHMIDALGKRIILRCPLIPGVNDRPAHFDAIAGLANSLAGVTEIDLEPYHPMGIEKNRRIGCEAAYQNEAFMATAEAEKWRDVLAARVAVPVIVM